MHRLFKPNSFYFLLFVYTLGHLGCASKLGCYEQTAKRPTVVLTGADGHVIRVIVEIASRTNERARGLMYRNQLNPDAGMLFIYPAETIQSFWMKNTYISLDMIFIGENLQVVGILQNTQPMSTERLSVETPSRYVLEVASGFVKKHAIRVGSPVKLEGIKGIGRRSLLN